MRYSEFQDRMLLSGIRSTITEVRAYLSTLGPDVLTPMVERYRRYMQALRDYHCEIKGRPFTYLDTPQMVAWAEALNEQRQVLVDLGGEHHCHYQPFLGELDRLSKQQESTP